MPCKQTVRNGMLAVITTVLVAVGLRATYSVTMPLAAAVLLIAAIWPVKMVLDRVMPPRMSLLATALVLLVILAGFVTAVYFSAAQIVRAFAQNWEQLETGYQSITQWADKWGITLGGQQGYDRLIGFGQELLSNAYTVLIYLGFVAILVVLGLPEVKAMAEKMEREFDADTARNITDVIAEIAAKVRLYLGITTLTSLLTGVACGVWTAMLGLDLALVWGVLNFLLNYVPVVGNLVGIIPPGLYALMQFQSWTMPAAVFAGLLIIQVTISNFVYPMLQGRGLSLSPVAILLAVAFWGWVWGIAGALIAVPLTVVLVVICEQFTSLRWVTVLMSVPKSEAR